MNEGYGRLVITIRPGDTVTIGNEIAIAYEKYSGGQMKMLINAPKSMRILRHEEERDSIPGESPQTVKSKGLKNGRSY